MPELNDNQELMNAFYEEAQSLLDEMRNHLSALGEGPNNKSSVATPSEPSALSDGRPYIDPSICSSLRRCAHTIKGASGIVGFSHLEELTKVLEMIFKAAQDGTLTINANSVILLCESVEACQETLNGQEVVDREGLLEQLNSILRP